MKVGAIRVEQPGGPEVLRWEEIELGAPAAGEVQIRHQAIGINFIEIYHRTGLYKLPLPFIPGNEAAGTITAVGAGVTEFKEGDRVAYCTAPLGAYSEARNCPADKLVALPSWIAADQAAAMMLKGLTTQYLLRRTYPVGPGVTVLIHAAAGGVGLIACQWAKALGATVIGTVGSDAKAELARAHGCHHPLVYTREDWVARVRDITDGRGVDIVYDSVGADTFAKSLDCVKRLGMIAAFGQSSGPVAPVDVATLNAKGSLFLTRPSLFNYMATREELVEGAAELFAMVKSGEVKIDIHQRFALRDAAQAHIALESRKTTGATILTV